MGWNVTLLRRDLSIGLPVLALLIVIPFLDPGKYIITQITLFFIWALVITQWNLVVGVAGIFSLAQMAIFAFGGYTAAMLNLYLDISMWLTAVVGGLLAIAFGVAIGAATLRLHGPYVALLTLAISQVMYLLIATDTACFYYVGRTCYQFTGGAASLSRFDDFGFAKLLGYQNRFTGNYYLGLFLLVMGTIFSIAIIRSPLGVAFRALRDNQPYAITRGVDRVKYQLLVFGLSSFFTGLAGAFYAGHFKVVGPNLLGLSLMLFLLTMMVVGGLGRIWGPLVGGALIMLADEGVKEFSEWRLLGIGALTMIFIIFLPQGVAGAVEDFVGRIRSRRQTRQQEAALPAGRSDAGE